MYLMKFKLNSEINSPIKLKLWIKKITDFKVEISLILNSTLGQNG